jgi:methionyl-tRNA formyltransferase
MNESAVKKYAVEHNLPLLQPAKLKDPGFLDALSAWKADLFVVVGFRMLPEAVWSMPRLGSFNLHAALLPQYRGAAPINWAIINGEKMSGVTTFMLDKEIDTGGIILRDECRISPDETAGELHDALMERGAALVVETAEGIIQRNVETRVQRSFIQGSEVLKTAPKLTTALCHIDWNDSTRAVYNLVRGLSPYPGAFTELAREGEKTRILKIFSASVAPDGLIPADARPGSLHTDGKTYLAVATADGGLCLGSVQLEGKKRMETADFLRGFHSPEQYTTTPGTSRAEIEKSRQQR